MTIEMVTEAINEKISDLGEIKSYDQFYTWKKSAIGTLKRVVPYNDTIIEHLSDLDPIDKYGHNRKDNTIRDSKQLLESLIRDIERCGLEEPPKNTSEKELIKVDVNQTNSQSQSTQVTMNFEYVIEVLKGELRNSEIEELKEILEEQVEPKIKKKRFVEKIKSFGSDVASNILANILTNPTIYQQLGGLL